jgi:hypothetical protein
MSRERDIQQSREPQYIEVTHSLSIPRGSPSPTDVLRIVVEASYTILIRFTMWMTTLSLEEVMI